MVLSLHGTTLGDIEREAGVGDGGPIGSNFLVKKPKGKSMNEIFCVKITPTVIIHRSQ